MERGTNWPLVDGGAHTLEVEGWELGSTVRAKYEDVSGVEQGAYLLMYAGKQITDTDVIASLNIREGATLHAVPEAPLTQIVPSPSLSLERKPVERQIKRWQDVAREGRFDADMRMLDPGAHHAWLKFLEDDIVENSEFFRSRGYYDLDDHTFQLPSSSSAIPLETPDSIQPLLVLDFDDFILETDDLRQMWHALVSLRKTYMIMSHVLAGLRHLRRNAFSGSAFNILLLHPDKGIAEIVPVSEELLVEMQQGVQTVLGHFSDDRLLPDELYVLLLAHIESPLCQVLEILGHSHDPGPESSAKSILELCRLSSLFVDLGLVCYVGSHGRRFDLEYLENDLALITVSSSHSPSFSFGCKRSRLACLDNYVDQREVWTFSCDRVEPMCSDQHITNTKHLAILTTIEDFADIWGPVWAVHSDDGIPDRIQFYQLAKGVIYPDDQAKGSQHEGSVRCHWTTSSDFQRRRETSLLRGKTWCSLTAGALLLIGATFRENSNCKYTLDDFENNFGHLMLALGPRGARLKLDSVSGGLSVSKVVGVSGQVTAKVVNQSPDKEYILKTLKFGPDHASIYFLHLPLTVQVSHCTGNAQRTQLRNLFLMAPVQNLLERICPGWTQEEWGPKFLRALHSENPDDMHKVWCDNWRKRRDMAQLIVPVLEVLADTGNSGDQFKVAFLDKHQQRYLSLPSRLNDWARVLQDVPGTAVYAIFSDKCLEAYTYNHSTATCDDHDAFTVLHTHLAPRSYGDCLIEGSIEINPSGRHYCEDLNETGSKIKVMTPSAPLMSPLVSIKRKLQGKNFKEVSARPRSAFVQEVFLKASRVSSGGFPYPRLRRQSSTQMRDCDLPSLPLTSGSLSQSQESSQG